MKYSSDIINIFYQNFLNKTVPEPGYFLTCFFSCKWNVIFQCKNIIVGSFLLYSGADKVL